MKIQGRYDLSRWHFHSLNIRMLECDEISFMLDVFTDWPKSQKSIRNLLRHMQSKLIGMVVTLACGDILYVVLFGK